MMLRVFLPGEVLLRLTVAKIVAEAQDGHFCLLPRHIDFVTALVPGLLSYTDDGGQEHFVAHDEAILVKCGQDVSVCTRTAVKDGDLGALHSVVDQQFRVIDDRERRARSAAARLEAGMVRRFMEFDKSG